MDHVPAHLVPRHPSSPSVPSPLPLYPPRLQKGSKVLADAMEALLGAFAVAGGHLAALAFLQVGGLGWEWGGRGGDGGAERSVRAQHNECLLVCSA